MIKSFHGAPSLILAIIALAALTVTSTACRNTEPTVTGFVIDIVSESIDTFSRLTIRDAEGRVWEFEGGRFPAFSPSHLREHQITGEKVKVTYRDEGGGRLRVVAIADG